MQKQSYWEKQRQKAMQKLADPAWREEQRAKRLQQAQRSSSEREKKPHRLNIGKRKLKKQSNMNSGEKIKLYPLRPKKHARHAA
ncbi:hypothetical protein ACVWP8_002980 [Escherichia coli]